MAQMLDVPMTTLPVPIGTLRSPAQLYLHDNNQFKRVPERPTDLTAFPRPDMERLW